MKKLIYIVAVLTLNFTLQTLNCLAQCPAFVNKSFESSSGTFCFNCTPPSWSMCLNTPDVSTGPVPPKDGLTYIGIGSYNNGTVPNLNEAFGQTLSTPLTIGGTYSFNMAMYRTDGGTSMNVLTAKAVIEIWGGSASCSETQLLWTSPMITDFSNWENHTVTFASPTSSWNNIIFHVKCPTCTDASNDGAYIYIDDLCGTPLPITLLTFTGSCTPSEKAAVKLQWSTASETNNDYFTIERSADAVNWEKAGTVKGAGNSSTQKNYEFTEEKPSQYSIPNTQYYYRLSQTDYDGKTEVFNDKQIAVDLTGCATQVFPNPVANQLYVPYTAAQGGEVILEVYDVIGKLVKDKTVTATTGRNTFTLNLTTVAQGMYILKIIDEMRKENNQKFVKQ